MTKNIKIFFILPTLLTGGAENVCTIIVNNLNQDIYEPYIVCLSAIGENLKRLSPHIKIIDAKSPSIHFSVFKFRKIFKEYKPDVVVSWMGYINAYLSFFIPFFPKKIKWVCRESSIPSIWNQHLRLASLFNFYYRFTNRFSKIICQNKIMADDLVKTFGIRKEKIAIISNPIDFLLVNKKLEEQDIEDAPDERFKLLFVGGLRKIKRIDLLIKTLSLLPPGYFLKIVGNGDQYENLQALISDLNLHSRIKIITNCYNPYPFYKRSDVLLLSSLVEGSPNVIIEGFSCGCPAIGYNIKGGANEVLNNYGGYVVESNNLSDLADKIINVCENEKIDRTKIIENCREKYDIKKIILEYERIFDIN